MSAADPAPPAPRADPLGRVVATERKPNTAFEFHFWTALDAPVGIGTIVRVDAAVEVGGVRPVVYGLVTEGFAYTDLQTPLHDVMGHDGSPASAGYAATQRAEVRLYTAAVLRQVPEEPLQPVPMGEVRLADDDDVEAALRMDAFLKEGARTAVPVGLYRSGGTESPVYVDADFLLGPEAAHLNITGVSGLATKTSAVEWLLASIFAHMPPQKGSVAAVCFNVKGPDLLFLDQPSTKLDDADRAIYERLGVPAAPFERVRYFAPYTAKGFTLATLRSHEALQHNVRPLTWGLKEVFQYAEVLLNKDDIDAKADALIDFVEERVINREFTDPLLRRPYRVTTFAELEEWFRDLLVAIEGKGGGDTWRTHHVATIRKVRNRLSNIALRCQGLVTDGGAVSDLPFGSFEDRTVYVVDVANMEEGAQDLVFTRVVQKLREHLERRDLGRAARGGVRRRVEQVRPRGRPGHVRPQDAARHRRARAVPGARALQRAAVPEPGAPARGGQLGDVALRRMDGDELATPGYAVLSPAVKTKLATLEKGQLMVRHPHFTQPVFVRFPRPAVMTGREGVERYPQAAEPSLEAAVARSLMALDSRVTVQWVQEVAALADEREVLAARDRTVIARPADVRAHFAAQFRAVLAPKAAAPAAPRVAPLRAVPDDDPYGF
jgi:hypothetical protein